MKPTFKHNVKTFKGINRKEDLVYCKYNDGEIIIVRTLPKRQATEQNHHFGAITKNLHDLYASVSPEYKLDLSNYAILHYQLQATSHKLQASGSAIFTKMLWNLKKQFPNIELSKISRDEILDYGYPIVTILEAMGSGMLLKIPEAMILDRKI
jgi:hypothetical protein